MKKAGKKKGGKRRGGEDRGTQGTARRGVCRVQVERGVHSLFLNSLSRVPANTPHTRHTPITPSTHQAPARCPARASRHASPPCAQPPPSLHLPSHPLHHPAPPRPAPSSDALRTAFAKHGTLLEASVVREHGVGGAPGRSRGFGYVRFRGRPATLPGGMRLEGGELVGGTLIIDGRRVRGERGEGGRVGVDIHRRQGKGR